MLRTLAALFGLGLVAIGFAGFFPEVTPSGQLLGVFSLNFGNDVFYLFSGLIALFLAAFGRKSSRIFFQIFGIIFALLAALGFFYLERPILDLMANNLANTFFHLFLATVFLLLGFGTKRRN